MTTTVIGAGIIGASLAYHLASTGSHVTILDKALPGSGATAESFAWIGKGPETHHPQQAALRAHVLSDYRRLEAEIPDLHVRWTGSLMWGDDHPHRGQPATEDRWVITGDQALTLEPALTTPPTAALHTTTDGAIDPAEVIAVLLAAARGHGASVRAGVAATRLRTHDGRVTGVDTTDGHLASDTVIIAAGADAPQLLAPLGFDLPVAPSPSVLMRFSAPPQLVRTLVSNDEVEVRQAGDGTLLAAWDYEAQTTPAELRAAGEAMLGRLRATFSGAEAVELLSVRVGMRPMPVDGSPVIGPVPGMGGVYLAVMHSGVTLAATVGRLVAAEVLDGVDAGELAPLRPERFAKAPPPEGLQVPSPEEPPVDDPSEQTPPAPQPAPATMTGAEMANLAGMLPSDFYREARSTLAGPRILAHPTMGAGGEWDLRCEACATVVTEDYESVRVMAHQHNNWVHGGALDVRVTNIHPPHRPPADTRIPDAWAKWNRGHARITDLVDRCQQWAATFQLQMDSEELAEGWTRWLIRSPERPVPADFSLDLGEAVGQLRSSLDVAVSELASTPTRTHAMPLLARRGDWARALARKLDTLEQAHVEVIRTAQPFTTHPDQPSASRLHLLEELWNADKHRLLPGSLGVLQDLHLLSATPQVAVQTRNALGNLRRIEQDITVVETRPVDPGGEPFAMSLTFANVRVVFSADRDRTPLIAAVGLFEVAEVARQLLVALDHT